MIIKRDTKDEDADVSTLYQDTLKHITEVQQLMTLFGWRLKYRGKHHDWTKIEYFNDFANAKFDSNCENDFTKREWYNTHTSLERHHLESKIPEDVDLFDIIEFMCNNICASYERKGWLDDDLLELDDEVLKLAYKNTIRYLANEIDVEGE